MNRAPTQLARVAAASLIGWLVVGVCAASDLFAPPVSLDREGDAPAELGPGTRFEAQREPRPPAPRSVPRLEASPPLQPVRVAMTCGVGSPGQPVMGRFGLFAPPPLDHCELSVEAYACPEPATQDDKKAKGRKKAEEPKLPEVEHHPVCHDPRVCATPCATGDFSADAFFAPYEPCGELMTYQGKSEIKTQRPLIEWGYPFYGPGPTPIGGEEFGPTNLSFHRFYVYGDYRVGFSQNDLVNDSQSVLAHRLNLELDYQITATERIHAFLGPFQEDARFMRVVDGDYIEEFDFFQAETDTLFFEGDFGAMLGGFEHTYAPFDMPFTFGLIPLLFQNGVWSLDAVVGAAVTLPAQNSPLLDWSNFDVTLFGGVDRISSDAFGFDEDDAAVIGATTFIESRGGYFEIGYGFVDDQEGGGRSYHNLGASYTRRYANLVSNSVRLILNTGQETGAAEQTADGALILIENTFLTKNPYNVLPYINVFAGFDKPQPLMRAGAFGQVLFNTGILFQSDLLTGYPTLDATGHDTYGAAIGVELLAPEFNQQLIVETAVLKARGARADRNAAGDQVGVGVRWQKALTTAHLIRADAMIGLLDNSDDVHGARIEYRWKF